MTETKPPCPGAGNGDPGVSFSGDPPANSQPVPKDQELSNDFLEARGVEAQAWYVGVGIGFQKLAHGEASCKALRRFVKEHRLLIKSAFWRGETQDSVLCRLVDLFFDEVGK